MLFFVYKDLWTAIGTLCFNPEFETEKVKLWNECFKTKLDVLQKHLGNKKFIITEEPRLVDFSVYEMLQYFKGIFPTEFKEYAHLN